MKLLNEMFSVIGGSADRVALTLNVNHPIYQAHFPGHPITPGVCIVQLIGELLSERTCYPLVLHKIVNLKFIAPLSPAEETAVEVVFSSVEVSGCQYHAKGTLTARGTVMTKFSLVFHRSDG